MTCQDAVLVGRFHCGVVTIESRRGIGEEDAKRAQQGLFCVCVFVCVCVGGRAMCAW